METLKNLDWNNITDELQRLATSSVGRSDLATTSPLSTPGEAEERMKESLAAMGVLRAGVRPFMTSLDLFPLWSERLAKRAVLKTLELRDVRTFCYEIIALKETLTPQSTHWCRNIVDELMDANRPLSAIDQVITAGGEIRTDASEKLYELYQEKLRIGRTIQNSLDRLVKQSSLENLLQDKYVTNREGRWVLPIKSGMQHSFPGIIHAASHSKQTVFMEPEEIIPLNNRLTELDIVIQQEIERILKEVSDHLSSELASFRNAAKILRQADATFARAQLAVLMEANPVKFSDGVIRLRQVRHPLLVLHKQAEEVVANDIILNHDKRILLLSGPNAGGKTVLLKSVGLAAHMARCGLLVCASSESTIPFFSDLHVNVGDSQSVDEHLSTFAAHVKILNDATHSIGGTHLVLIDEIAGSTDPEEGAALARSFIEQYAKNGVFAVITSHLGPLKSGWDSASGVVSGSLEYDLQTGRPTYQFLPGVPGASLAIQTAKRVGVSPAILTRAEELLSPETRSRIHSMQEVEELKESLQELRHELSQELLRARKKKEAYTQLVDRFRRERNEWLERALQKAEAKINEVVEAAKVKEIFRKHEVTETLRGEFPELIKAPQRASAADLQATTAEEFAKYFPPGSQVFVPSLGHDGVVQGTPNSRGEIPVLAQSMRVFVPWSELKPPRQAVNPTLRILRRTTSAPTTGPALSNGGLNAVLDRNRVIDLRGKRVEEALEILESMLDAAMLAGEDRVQIIHGHGTEALKKSVRSYLSRSPYVAQWKAQGTDDGVTWADLHHPDN